MTKRNIAIANFTPKIVKESSWPRFTGWKMIGNPKIESGLFGLIDKDVRMHRFFKDTTIEDVIMNELCYEVSTTVVGTPMNAQKPEGHPNTLNLGMPKPPDSDTSVTWLPPYQYIDNNDVEWDVYVLITGSGIHIRGDFHRIFKAEGYWDMELWKPKFAIGEEWDDRRQIEQATINYVVSKGYPAMTHDRAASREQGKPVYAEKNVYQEIPGYRS